MLAGIRINSARARSCWEYSFRLVAQGGRAQVRRRSCGAEPIDTFPCGIGAHDVPEHFHGHAVARPVERETGVRAIPRDEFANRVIRSAGRWRTSGCSGRLSWRVRGRTAPGPASPSSFENFDLGIGDSLPHRRQQFHRMRSCARSWIARLPACRFASRRHTVVA